MRIPRPSARDTGVVPPSLVDFSSIAAVRASAPSADGTLVPMAILHRKDLAHGGSHPAWLSVYGAFGTAVEPGFSPERLTWLERVTYLVEPVTTSSDGGVYRAEGAIKRLLGPGEVVTPRRFRWLFVGRRQALQGARDRGGPTDHHREK